MEQGNNQNGGFVVHVYTSGNQIIQTQNNNYYGTVYQGGSGAGNRSFSDEQVAKALMTCVGKDKVIDCKWKWVGAYWYLRWANQYPELCNLDTIGESVNGRLILCMHIQGARDVPEAAQAPEFFYSSTMHGDEVTGYVMMLRLIDTLLRGYGNNPQYTNLVDNVAIYINPLSNPDGTYRGGNNSIYGAMRYNANYVYLNRNYPDPFGTQPLSEQQPENTALGIVSPHMSVPIPIANGG